MSFPFEPNGGPIVVEASLSGPTGQTDLRLLLDTAATVSLVRPTHLLAVGHDPFTSPDRVRVAMGNGEEIVPRVPLNRLSALGHHRLGQVVLAHDLPPSTKVDGLLGLDFLRGLRLCIDFQDGRITLD